MNKLPTQRLQQSSQNILAMIFIIFFVVNTTKIIVRNLFIKEVVPRKQLL